MAYIYDLTDTWSAGGTVFNAIKMNVTDSASAVTSKLVSLQTNGTEHFSVTKAGAGYFSGNVGIGITPLANTRMSVRTATVTDTAYYADNGVNSGFKVKFASSLTSILNDFGADLVLGTNDTERMRISAGGNVGIGTATPGAKLDVNGQTATGNISVRGDGSEGGQITFSNAANTASALTLDVDNLGHGRLFTSVNNTNLTLGQLVGTGGIVTFNTASAERMRITATGSVGIGITNPQQLLALGSPTDQVGAGVSGTVSTVYFGQPSNLTGGQRRISYDRATGNLSFIDGTIASPTTQMTITAAGFVGVGTTAPGAQFENVGRTRLGASVATAAPSSTDILSTAHTAFSGAGGNYLTIGQYPTGQGFAQWIQSSFNNPTTAVYNLVLQPLGGNVGIGTSSPTSYTKLTVAGGLQVSGAIGSTASTAGGVISNEFPVTRAYIGDGSGFSWAFSSRSGSVTTDRVTIQDTGNLLVGTTSGSGGIAGAAPRLVVEPPNTSTHGVILKSLGQSYDVGLIWNTAASGDNRFFEFGTDATYTARGSISYNRAGGLVAYNVTSDYRAKDIIGPVTDAGATIDALKVYEGVMKGATIARPMLIAHEAQEIVPYAVTGEKDAVNEDGTDKHQQMDHQSFIPLLIAEIQSLRARVAQLEGN